MPNAAAAMVNRSVAWMPKSCAWIKRVADQAAPAPIATPAAATARITIQTTEPVSAPSARRMPVSLVRRATRNAITP
jgi:hypothetical protein